MTRVRRSSPAPAEQMIAALIPAPARHSHRCPGYLHLLPGLTRPSRT